MGGVLNRHAGLQPKRLAVVEDRPDGTTIRWTYAELERRANRLGHALTGLGVGRGTKVVWCGQNSPDVVVIVNAARKIGATAVPLNSRLSDEEATAVTAHCDATVVYVGAEFAPMFERIRAQLPKVRHIIVFDGTAPEGMLSAEAITEASPDTPP